MCCNTIPRTRLVASFPFINRWIAALAAVAVLAALAVTPASAQAPASGGIEGRVLNGSNGNYLSKVLVAVEGTNEMTLTNDYGEYSLRNVPAGEVSLRVTYTGQEPMLVKVTVEPGKLATQNVTIGGGGNVRADGTVQLDPFVVNAQRYKNAAAIAIAEERNSINIKNVVAAGQFGDIPSNNIGEFVKFLPGVQISYGSFGGNNQGYNDSDASGISIRGFSEEDTTIMIDGMPVSNATPGNLSRRVGLDQLSINNASRVELIKVATPDMPANSIGGSINLVTKSAFEYAKPDYSGRVYFNFNSLSPDLGKTPGPVNKPTYKTTPAFDFTVSYPVSSTFGVSFTGSAANEFNQSYRGQPTYTYTGTVLNSAGNVVSLTNPFLSRFAFTSNSSMTEKRSGNIKLDWKPTSAQLLRANVQYSTYNSAEAQRRLDARPVVTTGVDWTATQTVAPIASNGTMDMTVTTRDKVGETKSGQLQYSYQHGGWSVSAAGSLSVSTGDYKDRANGHFSEVALKLNPGQVSFFNVADSIPGGITTLKRGTSLPVDSTNLSNYGFDGTIAKSGEALSKNTVGLYKVDVERDLSFIPFLGSNSLIFKVGARRDSEKTEKSGVGTNYAEILNTGKSYLVSDILDSAYVGESPGFGFPAQQWASTYKLYELDQANDLFYAPEDGNQAVNNYNSYVGQQRSITETTTGAYVQLSGRFFKNRLNIVGGMRQEEKTREGLSPFTDGKWNYAKTADGMLYVDNFYKTGVKYDGSSMIRTNADGTTTNIASFLSDAALISRLTAAGVKFPDHLYGPTASSLESRKLNLIPNRYVNQKIKGDPSASLSGSFELTKKITLKAAWSRSFGLPSLESGTAGLVSGNNSFTINENIPVPADGTKGNITVANPGLLPQTSNNYDFEVSYYTDAGGKISASYWYKTVTNQVVNFSSFSGSPTFEAVLPALDLNPADYEDWKLSTSSNSSTKQNTHGIELAVQQDLGFLGAWGKRFSGFASIALNTLGAPPTVTPFVITSPSGVDITVTPVINTITLKSNRFGGAGLQYSGRRLSVQVRGTYKNDNEVTGRVTLPNGNFLRKIEPAETRIDLNVGYMLTRRYSLFLSGRDVFNGSRKTIWRDDLGLYPTYASVSDYREFGVSWSVGVNGKF